MPADAHFGALTVSDDHAARLADGLLGDAEQSGLHLGGNVGLVLFVHHHQEVEGFQRRVVFDLGENLRMRFGRDAVLRHDGAHLTDGVIAAVPEQRLEQLNFVFGEENRFAFGIQEKTGGVAALAGVVLNAQFAGRGDVRLPRVQTDGTHGFAAKHPGRFQNQSFVQGQGGFHAVQVSLPDVHGVFVVQNFHHVKAVAQQTGGFDFVQIQHFFIAGRHAPHGLDQIAGPHEVPFVQQLIGVAQAVKIVRFAIRYDFLFQVRIRPHAFRRDRVLLNQFLVQFFVGTDQIAAVENVVLDAVFDLVEVDQPAFFAHGFFDVLKTRGA